jgi:hypothetical protein
MRAARMYDYRQPPALEEIPIPEIGPSTTTSTRWVAAISSAVR